VKCIWQYTAAEDNFWFDVNRSIFLTIMCKITFCFSFPVTLTFDFKFAVPVTLAQCHVSVECDVLYDCIPRWFTHLHMVTHPSTNRARRRVTMLIETSALPLSQLLSSYCLRFNLSMSSVKFIIQPVTVTSLTLSCCCSCCLGLRLVLYRDTPVAVVSQTSISRYYFQPWNKTDNSELWPKKISTKNCDEK